MKLVMSQAEYVDTGEDICKFLSSLTFIIMYLYRKKFRSTWLNHG